LHHTQNWPELIQSPQEEIPVLKHSSPSFLSGSWENPADNNNHNDINNIHKNNQEISECINTEEY
jgi:hypothetical protein